MATINLRRVMRNMVFAVGVLTTVVAFAQPLSERQLRRVEPILGDYRGQWTTEASRVA